VQDVCLRNWIVCKRFSENRFLLLVMVFCLMASLVEALDFDAVLSSGKMGLHIYGAYKAEELNLNWRWEKYREGEHGEEGWGEIYYTKQGESGRFHMVANGVDMGRVAKAFGKKGVEGYLDCELKGVLRAGFFEIGEGNFVVENGEFWGKAIDALFPKGASDKLRGVFMVNDRFPFHEAMGALKKVDNYIVADTTFYTSKGSLHQVYLVREDELKAMVVDFLSFARFRGGGLR